jgi:hypothetical protein
VRALSSPSARPPRSPEREDAAGHRAAYLLLSAHAGAEASGELHDQLRRHSAIAGAGMADGLRTIITLEEEFFRRLGLLVAHDCFNGTSAPEHKIITPKRSATDRCFNWRKTAYPLE